LHTMPSGAPATRLPKNVLKRWKKVREENVADDIYWNEVKAKAKKARTDAYNKSVAVKKMEEDLSAAMSSTAVDAADQPAADEPAASETVTLKQDEEDDEIDVTDEAETNNIADKDNVEKPMYSIHTTRKKKMSVTAISKLESKKKRKRGNK
jgi:hypothetical protein